MTIEDVKAAVRQRLVDLGCQPPPADKPLLGAIFPIADVLVEELSAQYAGSIAYIGEFFRLREVPAADTESGGAELWTEKKTVYGEEITWELLNRLF